MTTRDTPSSSDSSFSVPSPRTVTRYRMVFSEGQRDPYDDEGLRHFCPSKDVVPFDEVESLLSALAEAEQDNAQLATGFDAALDYLTTRFDGVPENYETICDQFREMARRFAVSRDALKHEARALTARAEAAEARIVELNVIMIAAEAQAESAEATTQIIEIENNRFREQLAAAEATVATLTAQIEGKC